MKKPEKTLSFNGYEIAFKLSTYRENGVLALIAYEYTTYGCPYEYGVVSVNIEDLVFGPTMTYIDENNHKGMAQFLVDNGIATYVGYTGFSGYCQYPLVNINFDELKKYHISEDDEDVDVFFDNLIKDFLIRHKDDEEEIENQAEGPDEEDDNVQSFFDFLDECKEWDEHENETSDDKDVDDEFSDKSSKAIFMSILTGTRKDTLEAFADFTAALKAEARRDIAMEEGDC